MKLDQGHQSNTLKSLNTKCEVANQMHTMKVWSEALAPADINTTRKLKLEVDLHKECKTLTKTFKKFEAGAPTGVYTRLMIAIMNRIRDLLDRHPQEMTKFITNVAKNSTELTNLAMSMLHLPVKYEAKAKL